jgi:hypothetical protein
MLKIKDFRALSDSTGMDDALKEAPARGVRAGAKCAGRRGGWGHGYPPAPTLTRFDGGGSAYARRAGACLACAPDTHRKVPSLERSSARKGMP